MKEPIKYRDEVHKATVNGKEITVIDHIPVFPSEEEREEARRRIGKELYRIFVKYVG